PPRLVDVSVLLAPSLATYPGNPPFELAPVKRIAEGGSSNVSRLTLGTHTGTHVDAPRHFFDGKPGVDALALELLIGRTRVINLPDAEAGRYEMYCLPLKILDADGAPARVVLKR